ncbi:hypothetical protein [Nakamurella leprariae]|uniref:Uncharacterized protein n=1 Tax=Nakamurella leprariae TaxID=2803911 RepID=A0A938Y743_9ACTN|nr:hypothetical protein [Nakamurella leprariae]MBM9467251.1 hypothetical protein [Nakamurella leprariae]
MIAIIAADEADMDAVDETVFPLPMGTPMVVRDVEAWLAQPLYDEQGQFADVIATKRAKQHPQFDEVWQMLARHVAGRFRCWCDAPINPRTGACLAVRGVHPMPEDDAP